MSKTPLSLVVCNVKDQVKQKHKILNFEGNLSGLHVCKPVTKLYAAGSEVSVIQCRYAITQEGDRSKPVVQVI